MDVTGRATRKGALRFALIAAVVVGALMVPAAASAATPSKPALTDVYVSGDDQITLEWTASTDRDGHELEYYIYRRPEPLNTTNSPVGATPIAGPIDGTSYVLVTTATNEAEEAYVWYYAIRAREKSTTNRYFSTLSQTMAPNLHGFRELAPNAVTCLRCHGAHGTTSEPWTYRDLGLCYSCHATDAKSDRGAKSTYNIKNDFKEYDGQVRGSWHRSDQMTANTSECDACHDPHKSPYWYKNDGNPDQTQSYRKMLRVQTGPDTYAYYSANNVDAESGAFCLACHGKNATPIGYVGDADDYAATAGDHNEDGYATAAHGISGATSVKSNDFTKAGAYSAAQFPQVQCLACHDKHASAADKLIAYRGADLKADGVSTYAQAELCFKCHSEAGATVEKVAGTSVGGTNLAWNGRDVQAEFAKKTPTSGSSHPVRVQTGDAVASLATWTQTAQADFQADTLVNAVATSGGSVELEPIYTASTILNEGFESNNFTTNGWTETGTSWAPSTGNTHSGTYKASVEGATGTDYFHGPFDTSGLTDPQISFWWSFNGSGTDWFAVDVSTDGSTWSTLMPQRTADQLAYTQSTYSIPVSATTWIRFGASLNNTGEYARVDDVVISGMEPGGTYLASGSALSTAISPAGSLEQWGTLVYSKSQPSGTALSVDVLDASDDSVLLTGAASGASLGGLSAPSLKLRANLTGNAGTPRSVTDDFNDNSFDTAKWTDRFLNSTDPDSPSTVNLSTVTFQTALIDATTGVDSRNPNVDGTGWYRNTGTGSDGGAGYARTGATEYDSERTMLKSYGDLSAYTGASASFYWQNGNSTMSTGDYLYVEWSANGGSTWTTIGSVTSTAADGTWGQLSNASLPVGTNCQLRVRTVVRDAVNDEWYLDTIAVSLAKPATTEWPKEANQQLTLRAEGAGFTGTADQGEFTYITPSQFASGWVNTADFDLRVYLGAVRNNTPQAGLMIRTGTTEANAYATNAPFVGLWPTGGSTATFAYRATAGGTVNTNGTTATTLPRWLRIVRTGNSFAAYISGNGSTWTQVGSNQTVTMSMTVLVGLATTSASGTDLNYSEADYDDFSITEAGLTSTVTPALDDWTVTYDFFPAATTGEITCANCHNVHSVGTGGSEVWDMARASDPADTTNPAPSDPSTFCLRCHKTTDAEGRALVATSTATSLVPYTVKFTSPAAPFFPGWDKALTNVNWNVGAHENSLVRNMNPGCDTCHDPHASANPRLTALTAYRTSGGAHINTRRDDSATYAEENLCYACHAGGTSCAGSGNGCHSTNTTYTRSVALMNVQTAFSGTYRHPVGLSGRHTDLEDGGDSGLGKNNRHAECADCHDPHAARAGLHPNMTSTTTATKSSKPGEALRGASGITVATWPANWTTVAQGDWTAERMDGEDTDFEAYVCLKCHSSYTTQPASVTRNTIPYTPTDIALEFNPSNQSEHNVFGQRTVMETAFNIDGKPYTWAKPADSAFLKTGWNSNSPMTCTDCHANNTAGAAKGPHGSTVEYLIADGYTTWTNTSSFSTTSLICFKCHTNLATSNIVHKEHDTRGNEGGYCRFCHVKVPHGWQRPRLLGYTTDPEPYATIPNGLIEIQLQSYTAISNEANSDTYGWNKDDCYAGCSTGRHPNQATAWP